MSFRKLLIIGAVCLAALFVIGGVALATNGYSGNYVGNSQTNQFHYPYCYWGENIPPEYYMNFDNRQAAVDQGYAPCNVCNP